MSDTTTIERTNTLPAADVPSAPPEAHQRAGVEGSRSEYKGLSATYSPEDNKLRLYAVSRLDSGLYERVKAAGFAWAPRQQLFVAPMWTPGREDLLIELCGEIGDEDTSLVQRAEERAERFEDYSDKRGADASAAREAVSAISSRFEFGQPILIGHHSERRARKDKERIENNMRKAVKMWETSEYWAARAEGAKAHAHYKQLPAVRHRRIKTLEAEMRKQQRSNSESESALALWTAEGLTLELAIQVANVHSISTQREGKTYRESVYSLLSSGEMTLEEAVAMAKRVYTRNIEWRARWIAHYTNRIAYEKAMLGESGGLAADAYDIKVGGRVLVGGEWLTVLRVNRTGGAISSVSTNSRYVRVKSIEQIKGYEPPSEDDAAKVKKATTLPPMCNYPGEGFHSMTKAEWADTHKDYKGSRQLGQGAQRMQPGSGRPDIKPGEGAAPVGLHRVRTVVNRGRLVPVFLSDEKRKDPPPAPANAEAPVSLPAPERVEPRPTVVYVPPAPTEYDAMRSVLRNGGVQVVSAPQLFPTPDDLAERMVIEAGVSAGDMVLEPSAGTGSLLRALAARLAPESARTVAVEINAGLAAALSRQFLDVSTICGDFLRCAPRELGLFDVILMNPPFANAQDIEHINHARTFLRPGGRLVAICANGPRQQKVLEPIAKASGGFYEANPAGSFKDSGTNVSTALLVIYGN